MYQISELGRSFGLSRSTLLYYDRIGLLRPSGRSEAGYRLYSDHDRDRLATICSFRQAGLAIEDIRRVFSMEGENRSAILQRRMLELAEEISILQSQQRLLARMLQAQSLAVPAVIDKGAWVDMLRAAGMDDAGMALWHRAFEDRAPEAHHQFLRSLGIPEDEALAIRKWSKDDSDH